MEAVQSFAEATRSLTGGRETKQSALRVASYLRSVLSFWPSRSPKVIGSAECFPAREVPYPLPRRGATRSTGARPLASLARAWNCLKLG